MRPQATDIANLNTSDTVRSGSLWTTHKDEAYRPEIDGLRALAVLAVILAHFDSVALPSGHLGVDVFFVISGFVISSSLYSRRDPTFAAFLGNFYVRRLKRLLPALIACVLITGLAICLFDPSPGASLKTGLFSLVGLSNLYLLHNATDYFGKPAQLNVFTHTWSLGVEEQFYLAFPFVLWLTGFARTGALRPFSMAIGALSAVSVASFIYLSQTNEAAAFYLMPARFWELGIGCLAFVAIQRGGGALELLRKHARPLALIVMLCAVFAVPKDFALAATIAAVLLTALLILALKPDTLGYGVLSHPWAVYIGQISYSLYLWHWSVLSLSRWTVGVEWWLVPFQAALMLLLAALSYRWLERPLRSARWGATPAWTISYGAAASLSAAAVLVALGTILEERLYTGQSPRMAAKGVATLIDPYRNAETNLVWLGAPCVISNNNEVGKIVPIAGCTLGNFENAKRRILVVGNSFSAAFVRGFDELVSKDGYAVTITAAWAAELDGNVPNNSARSEASNYYWSRVVPTLAARLTSNDAVFLVFNLAAYLPKGNSEGTARLNRFGTDLERLSSNLRSRNIDLYVLHGNPFTREAGCEPDMAAPQWFSPFGRPCRYYSRADNLARRQPIDLMLSSLSRQGKIRVVDLFDVFCPAEVCTYVASNGQMLYRDSYSHPSVEAAMLAAPVIRRALLETHSRPIGKQ